MLDPVHQHTAYTLWNEKEGRYLGSPFVRKHAPALVLAHLYFTHGLAEEMRQRIDPKGRNGWVVVAVVAAVANHQEDTNNAA